VNLFIADDVGLGKTIEAGLIARELLLRKKVREIVVAAPPSMLTQWQEELETRFGLTFAILDREYVTRVRRERGYGVNPWTTHSRFLVSHRLLVDEAYAGPLRDWLGDMRPAALLILDEVHHAAPASGSRYAIDSQITRAARDLAYRFEHRLFLSATPHNGHSNSFSALLELLDPQRFCRGVPVRSKKLLDDVMVRRLKDDVREVVGGFAKRDVVQVDVDGLPEDAPELRLVALLDEYRRAREDRMRGEPRRTQSEAALVISGLQHRLLSSVEAFARTLKVHRRGIEKQWERALAGEPPAPPVAHRTDLITSGVGPDDERLEEGGDATDAEAEGRIEAEEGTQFEAASTATAGPVTTAALIARERELLDTMTALAASARGAPDARVRQLVAWIRTHLCPGGRWNRRRVLVFTEWDATLTYLRQQLEGALADTDRAGERIEVFHGFTPSARREELKHAFNADPDEHPVRILLATDAAREGLNLQTHCGDLFHFDVPWNPARLEQRNGRIDRKLQPEPEVRCHYFVHLQRPEDRVLRALVQKTETIKRELGSLSPVVEARLERTLQGGIYRATVDAQVAEIDAAHLDPAHREAIAVELEEVRERQDALRRQLDRLETQLAASRRWIGLEEEQFRAAISCALGLAGAARLSPDRARTAVPRGGPSRRSIACPGPTRPGPSPWTRSVRRDGRISSTGSGGAIPQSARSSSPTRARWTSGSSTSTSSSGSCSGSSAASPRRGSCTTTSRAPASGSRPTPSPGSSCWAASASTARGRHASTKSSSRLRRGGAIPPSEGVPSSPTRATPRPGRSPCWRRPSSAARRRGSRRRRSGGSAITRPAMWPSCSPTSRRGGTISEKKPSGSSASGARARRGREILEAQQKRVAEAAARYADPQLVLDFGEEERRQIDADRRHWERRLASLVAELETEPERIRRTYTVHARRLEPVGLVYLWPVPR
jgi:superfamily II DNA/RNA helicase